MDERHGYGHALERLWSDKALLFIMGPRQAGKTTLAKAIAARTPSEYVNWDIPGD